MYKKKYDVGIMITPSDADIAAYFNFLRDQDQSITHWLTGMLIADDNDQPFPIQDFTYSNFKKKQNQAPAAALLFGSGSTSDLDMPKPKWEYGWQVRGDNNEYIEGSVINITFRNPHVVNLLISMHDHNTKISTYIKYLIRHNMSFKELEPITERKLKQIIQESYLKTSSQAVQPNIVIPEVEVNSDPVVDSTSEPEEVDDEFMKNPLMDYIY